MLFRTVQSSDCGCAKLISLQVARSHKKPKPLGIGQPAEYCKPAFPQRPHAYACIQFVSGETVVVKMGQDP